MPISTASTSLLAADLEIATPLLTPKAFLDTVLGNVFRPGQFAADLLAIGIARNPTDPELLPNVSDRDY